MRFLCLIGLHLWRTKETARPGTTVSRCQACHRFKVRHGQKKASDG